MKHFLMQEQTNETRREWGCIPRGSLSHEQEVDSNAEACFGQVAPSQNISHDFSPYPSCACDSMVMSIGLECSFLNSNNNQQVRSRNLKGPTSLT